MQHAVAGRVDARRPKAHLRVLVDTEEVRRPQMLVALRIPGVDALGVDRQFDRRRRRARPRTSRRTGRSGREPGPSPTSS